jgi:hypothetical protein
VPTVHETMFANIALRAGASLPLDADHEERALLWPMMVQIYGPYAQYQTKTDRQIPVVVLKPV